MDTLADKSRKRLRWIGDVQTMLHKLNSVDLAPLPKYSTGNTFIAMVVDGDNKVPGELFKELAEITRLMPGAVQEHYDYVTDPEVQDDDQVKRIRLLWMFGGIRYEIDAPIAHVFNGNQVGPISKYVTYIGENVNTVYVPDSHGV